MTVVPAINVYPLHTDITRARAAIAPPFRRSKETDNWSVGGHSDVGGARVASDIDLRSPRQSVKSLQ